jgi:hypothetical protein
MAPEKRMNENLTSYESRKHRKDRTDYESASAVWVWKIGVKAMRTIRDTLLLAIYQIEESTDKTFCLALVDPEISTIRLEKEVDHLKRALRPVIAQRLELAIFRQSEFELVPKNIPKSELARVRELIEAEVKSRSPLPRVDQQSEVLRVLLYQWLKGNGPMTISLLTEIVGCNYRTVDTTIKKLGTAIKRESDRRVSLKYFPEDYWARFIVNSQKARGSIYYTDRSGQPRSVKGLIERLKRLQRNEIALGGVLGAEHYYPYLDITSPPRLDLCIHAPGKHFDINFVDQLDLGLDRTDNPNEKVYVAIHFLRRKKSFFSQSSIGVDWADPVECLVDLYDARLDEQASAFQAHLSILGREKNATSQ